LIDDKFKRLEEEKIWFKEKQMLKEGSRPADLPILHEEPKLNKAFQDLEFYCMKPGIYQLRMTSGNGLLTAELTMSGGIDYGVSFQNGSFLKWTDEFTGNKNPLFLYIPKNCKKFTLSGSAMSLITEEGEKITVSKTNKTHTPKVTDVVWKVSFPKKYFSLSVYGIPFILCNSENFALKLKGSVVELKDGSLVSHQFQKEIAEKILPEFLKEEYTGRKEELIKHLPNVKTLLMKKIGCQIYTTLQGGGANIH